MEIGAHYKMYLDDIQCPAQFYLGAFDAILSEMNAPIKSGMVVKVAMDVYGKKQ